MEVIAAVRAHMLFGLGWVDRWGKGKVVFFRQGSCENCGTWRYDMMIVSQ